MGYQRSRELGKSSLLDSISLGSSDSAGDWIEWDITLAVQNAMRENRSVDLILGIIDSGSGNNRDILLYQNSASSANRPEISFVYVPGSDALPSDPTPVTPLNGSWSIEQGINPAPNQNPQLSWNYTFNNANVGGWSVELDTTQIFDSTDLVMATSWNNVGFDITNRSTMSQRNWTREKMVLERQDKFYQSNWKLVGFIPLLATDTTTWSIDLTRSVELRWTSDARFEFAKLH